LRQSSRTLASLTIVETTVDTMVSMVRRLRIVVVGRDRSWDRKFAFKISNNNCFQEIFGEGKENLNVC